MGKKALDAERTIEMLQSMAKETSDQNGQFSGYAGWLTSQHMHSGRLSSGRTATAIANFWKETHRPFLNLLRDVMQDFSEKLNQLQNDISDTFTSEAVVKESFMMDQLYDELDQLKTVARQHGEALWDIKSEYSDVLSMPSFDYSRIEQSLSNSQNIINETTSQLYDTDSKMKTPMDYVAEDIELMRTYVDQIRTMISSGTLSIENFSRSQIRDEEAYKDVKSAWRQRDANNAIGFMDSFVGKPFGVFQDAFSAGTEFLPGAAIGIGFYARHGAVSFKGGSMTKSYLESMKDSKTVKKFSTVFSGAKSIVRHTYESAVSNMAQSATVQNAAKKIGVFGPGGKLEHIANSRATRFIGPVGSGFTAIGHLNEFTDPDNRDKSGLVKSTRFITGVSTELGGATIGAFIGGALLTPIPGGTFVGAAIGGYLGGAAAGRVVDSVKDGAEYIASGQLMEDAKELQQKVANTATEAIENIGDSVSGLFKGAADSVSGWFS
ncbi:LXG domain-containing protein [Shouchella miscanthi]|uniref:LXG domain-containing protein n=1 Tax=Shouchella miscanthi TaxID=2598861 RepID=A0ABU6NR99_9BACI|nr:LXG domain-containing protein [Shouchella miscanthi]